MTAAANSGAVWRGEAIGARQGRLKCVNYNAFSMSYRISLPFLDCRQTESMILYLLEDRVEDGVVATPINDRRREGSAEISVRAGPSGWNGNEAATG